MSTPTNVNYGQPRAATPTPSRPTSSYASGSPMHAAGAHSVNLQLPTLNTPTVPAKNKALQTAIQKYEGLSDDDKAAFLSAPNVIERLQEMQHNGKISSSLTTRVEKVLQCIKNFMGSLGILIQQSPEISSLVVGGVNCILTVGIVQAILY